jgi:uncharacterized LabA/DUF88 family protein
MATPQDNISMALFCDFENVALGVRDANYDKFDIKRVLERLLLKGSIVVKKSYCDWERYKGFKAAMHEANFELIEIPHVRQSGKNSADIRLVVDALDLCYTKSHVNTFVIISGDSDFSPLVSKLRENAKYVIGVGVKNSTSDLLIANCDEFIFYDDLVRESQRQAARRDTRENREPQQARRTPEEEARRREELDLRRTKAVEIAAETYDALVTDRDEGGRIWASVLKEAIKRRNPGFNENYYGFRTFGNLLEEAKARGLLEFGRDEKSSAFVFRGTGVSSTRPEASLNEQPAPRLQQDERESRQQAAPQEERHTRGQGRDGAQAESMPRQPEGAPAPAASEADEAPAPARRGRSPFYPDAVTKAPPNQRPKRDRDEAGFTAAPTPVEPAAPVTAQDVAQAVAPAPAPAARQGRSERSGERSSERKPAAKKAAAPRQGRAGKSATAPEAASQALPASAAPAAQAAPAAVASAPEAASGDSAAPAAAKKSASRSRRPRTSKPKASEA